MRHGPLEPTAVPGTESAAAIIVDEEPHGPRALDRHRLKHPGCAVRGAVPVLASLAVGPWPTDLVMPDGLALSVLLAVLISGQAVADGRSDWLKGAELLTVYLVLGLTYFFIPGTAP